MILDEFQSSAPLCCLSRTRGSKLSEYKKFFSVFKADVIYTHKVGVFILMIKHEIEWFIRVIDCRLFLPFF